MRLELLRELRLHRVQSGREDHAKQLLRRLKSLETLELSECTPFLAKHVNLLPSPHLLTELRCEIKDAADLAGTFALFPALQTIAADSALTAELTAADLAKLAVRLQKLQTFRLCSRSEELLGIVQACVFAGAFPNAVEFSCVVHSWTTGPSSLAAARSANRLRGQLVA